jgi:hypothetical protein
MKKIIPAFFVFFFALCASLSAQDMKSMTIDGLYIASMDDFLDQLSQKNKIIFAFDRAKLSKIKVEQRYFNVNLEDALTLLCKKNKLKFFKGSDNAIHIIDMYENPNADAIAKRQDAEQNKAKAPERFNFAVTGKIQDAQSRESLPYVSIWIKGTTIGTSSNNDGNFSLLKVPSDTCVLVVSYIGYQNAEIRLSPTMNISALVIELLTEATNLQEVVVKATQENLLKINEKVSVLKLTPAKLASLPNIGEKDMFRALQLMPGVSAANENSAGLYVRGGTPDQSLVLYDGFTVYHVDHLFGFFSAFNTNAIKDLQLYKGGFEAKYGGRIASVAEITGKEGNQRRLTAGADASLLSVNAYVEVPVGKKMSFLFAGRKSYKGPLYNKLFNKFSGINQNNSGSITPRNFGGGRGGFSNTANQISSFFYDLNGKFTYRPTERDVISLSFYNGTDKMDNSRHLNLPSFLSNRGGNFQSDITDLTKWGNTGASLKWSRQWNSKLYTNALVSYSNYFSIRDRSVNVTITNADLTTREIKNGTLENNNLQDVSFKIDNEYKLNSSNQVEFGVNLTHNDIKYTYSQNDTSTVIDRSTKGNILTGYVQDRIKIFNNKLTLVPGIRATNYSVTSKNYFEPRMSAVLKVSNPFTIKAAVGRYYQFAKRVIREDILQGSRDFWVLADNNKLPVTSSDHYILGMSYETNGYLFDVEGYYKKLQGLSEYSLRFTPTRPGEVNYNENFYQGTGTTKGIDFLVQKKYGNLNGWVGYTLSQTLYNFPIYSDKPFHASQDVTHEFKTVGIYKLKNWNFSLTWIYATGKPYTAPTGGYSVTLLDGSTKDYVTVSGKNSLRLPDYHRLDAAISYNWVNARGNTNSLGISFFNIYNRRNVWYKEYQIQSGKLIETDVTFLGFTPNLTLSLKPF